MVKRSTRSPTEFAKSYKADSTGTYAERCAGFLNDGAKELPYRFFPKTLLAKIAFGHSRTPDAQSDYVKKRLGSVMASAERILVKEHNREIYVDPVEGVRATVDDADLLRTKHRRKRRRVRASIASLKSTDERIDASKLDADQKRELQKSRRSINALSEALGDLPQLLPAKGKSDVSDD
jgi:hypothetical protein